MTFSFHDTHKMAETGSQILASKSSAQQAEPRNEVRLAKLDVTLLV